MVSIRNVMGSGAPGQLTRAIVGGSTAGLTATGTTQADALLIASTNSQYTTVANGTGALLPPADPGDTFRVFNNGANALLVYPQVGGGINNGAANAGFSVAANKSAQFNMISATPLGRESECIVSDTLLQLMQTVCNEIGLPEPDFIVTSTDTQIKQLLSLANREGREQASAPGGWPQLRGEQSIVLVNGQAAYDFPADFDSYIPDTIWDRDMRWPVAGPLSAQEWQFVKSGLINSQPWMRYRVMSGQLFIDPTPTTTTAGQAIVIEYQSKSWCQSAAGVPQTAWGADDDIFRLPDDVMVLGVKWRFLAAKRMDYSEEKAAWSASVDREQARSYVGKTQPLNRISYSDTLGGWGNIPDGNYPGRT